MLHGPARAGPGEVAVSIRIAAGTVPRAQRVLRVPHQSLVRIDWSSDRPTTVHLEGYDISVTVRPGQAESMRLKAFATGRFAVHAHDGEARGKHAHGRGALMWLEVHPQ